MKKVWKVPAIVMGLSVLFFAGILDGCAGKEEKESASVTVSEEVNPNDGVFEVKGPDEPDHKEPEEIEETEETVEADPALEILESMTLEEKIWQMFVITPSQLMSGDDSSILSEEFTYRLTEKPVGGLMFYGTDMSGPEATKAKNRKAIEESMRIEGMPLFLCIDEEGGRVARIGCRDEYGVTKVGPMGNIKSEEAAYEAGATIGEYLVEYGFNFDLAPCADALTDPDNTAIGDRSFGSDVEIVSKYAEQFAKGLHANDILSCYKHFPGHGGSFGDTHDGFIATDKTLEEMLDTDLYPFQNLTEADCVMVAHISAPNVTGNDKPSSLSITMITDVLRGHLKYEGLIMCDALNMGAIADYGTQDEVSVTAVEAGIDLVLVPSDVDLAYEGILNAVKNGKISEERIDESVLRIIHAKLKLMEEEE